MRHCGHPRPALVGSKQENKSGHLCNPGVTAPARCPRPARPRAQLCLALVSSRRASPGKPLHAELPSDAVSSALSSWMRH